MSRSSRLSPGSRRSSKARPSVRKTRTSTGSLAWLAWVVARLGGWNCYYKPPGPKTMHQGWTHLATFLAGFAFANNTDADV
jgi:hypothetical protein